MDRKAHTDKIGRRRQKNGLATQSWRKTTPKETRSPMRAWTEEKRTHVGTYVLVTLFLFTHTQLATNIVVCMCELDVAM